MPSAHGQNDAVDPLDGYQPERPVGEECGVFGVWAPGEDVAKLTYYGLYALQHRGQEAAGMAVSDGSATVVYKELGLVAQVFDESVLQAMKGHLAIGHCRYSTTGSCTWENAQPSFRQQPTGGSLALGHNGNLTNTSELARRVAALGLGKDAMGSTNDSDLITALLAASADRSLEASAREILPTLRGAFSLVFMDEHTLYAARDPHGVRPLVIGRLESGWVVASETAALDIVGATFVREVEPGELIVIDEHGFRASRYAEATPKGCLFEYVYLARPDTTIAGQSVYTTRVQVGRTLAFEAPVDADLVIPVPESGTPAAIGFAEQSGIPYGQGLVKNAYVGRTFIQPSQTIRQLGIRLKLNPLREVIKGKRLVVVDDSIVRGNTQRALVRMLREAGAAEVHVRISSPPVMNPCFYGIDFASKAELIASGLAVEEIRASIGADSLAFVSLDGLTAASAQPADKLCRACFTGEYPIALPEQDLIGKHVLEGLTRNVQADQVDQDGALGSADVLAPGGGGGDALSRP
ncbi:MAG: amidophosphoribosyltransferase [Frankiales bacterium]|nr:amidophosphoribosyltransferase [Frankiales bacterium]